MVLKYVKLGLASTVLFTGLSFAEHDVSAVDYAKKIQNLAPGVKLSDIQKSVKTIAKQEKKSTATVYKELYVELSKDSIEGASEAKKLGINLNNSAHIMGGNSSNEKKSHYLNAKKLNKKIKKGHFFYTPSSTYVANHGHVGLFYSKTAIVESVPGAGVRRISVSKRRVDNKGAVLKSVTVSTKKRDAAANWANSRVGKDKYSTNFFNNRTTSHYGDKNCSKLIWSAYKLKAHIDLDNDKGKGVYPRDIRDSKLTKKVATI